MSVKMHSDSAERAVISVGVRHPHTLDTAGLQPCDFLHPARAQIWQQLLTLRVMGKQIDETAVDALWVEGNEHVRQEWVECICATGSSHVVDVYAETIREHALTRRVLDVLGEWGHNAATGKTSGSEFLAAAQGALARLGSSSPATTTDMGTMVRQLYKELDEAYQRRQAGESVVRGVPTGIRQWDDWGGIHRGIVTVLAGRPAMGKSAVSQTVTQHVVEAGYGVHVFSLEDSWQSYTSRALARSAGVALARIRGAQLQRQDMTRLTAAAGRLCQWPRFGYATCSSMTAAQVVTSVRRERERLDTQLVVVDYLQRLRKPDRRMSKQEALEENLSVLADAASADELAFLVLSQLSRKTESRADKRPEMEDLRGAGEIEELAKCVIGTFRPGYYDMDPEDEIELLVVKNNDGPTGTIRCRWDGEYTRVVSRA